MKMIHPIRHWRQRLTSLTVGVTLLGSTAFGDIEKGRSPTDDDNDYGDGPPRVIRHIGNFFYKLASKLEESNLPKLPFHDPPPRPTKKSSPKPPVKRTPSKTLYSGESNDRQKQAPQVEKKPSNAAPTEPKLASPPPENIDAIPNTAPKDDAGSKLEKPTGEAPATTDSPPKGTVKPEQNHIPAATRTNKYGRVKSPFPPYTELDVAGMGSGSLAKDPTTGGIFRIP